jgi:heptosyltransferase I
MVAAGSQTSGCNYWNSMRVLIIKTYPLAEVISTLPVLDYLHKAHSDIQVDWVVEDDFVEVLEGNPLVDSIIPVKGDEWKRGILKPGTIREVGAFKEAMARNEYDFCFDFEGTLKSGVIGRFATVKERIGFQKGEGADSGNLLFSMRRLPLRRQDRHVTFKCLRLASIPLAKDYSNFELGATVVTGPEDDLAAEVLLATLSDGLVFLFDCGADAQTKLWSEQGWIDLGQRVLDNFPETALLLCWESDEERELALRIAKAVPGARVLDELTLKGLAALLKKVDLVVAGDTETVQLAAALGTPTVSFYRSSDGKSCGPRGERHIVIQSPIHCTRCLRERCDKDAQCRTTIKVDTVLAGIKSLFPAP